MAKLLVLLISSLGLAATVLAQERPADLHTRRVEFLISGTHLSVPLNFLPPADWAHPPTGFRNRPARDFSFSLVWPDFADPSRPEALACTETQGTLCPDLVRVSVIEATSAVGQRWAADAPLREPEPLGVLNGLIAQRNLRPQAGQVRAYLVQLHLDNHAVFGFVAGQCVGGDPAGPPPPLAVFGHAPSACLLRFNLAPGVEVAVNFHAALLPEWETVLGRVRAFLLEWRQAAG